MTRLINVCIGMFNALLDDQVIDLLPTWGKGACRLSKGWAEAVADGDDPTWVKVYDSDDMWYKGEIYDVTLCSRGQGMDAPISLNDTMVD